MKKETHILLVDDDPKGLDFLDIRLRQLGYRTTIAQNGEVALEFLRQDPPRLVLLDVTMPELNGYQTCREMKKLRPDMPIIILTGKTEPADRFWAFQSGADEFLNKPVDPGMVLQRIAALIAEP
jgi:DNA-binding response OmpR family regulator